MRFIMCLVAAMMIMSYVPSFAEDSGGNLDKWLKDMKGMIEKIIPKKAATQATTAVSGVRGADENSGDALYWRGKKENISQAELTDFRNALELAEEGKKEEAIKKFEEFLLHYPSSALSKDAEVTIDKLKSS